MGTSVEIVVEDHVPGRWHWRARTWPEDQVIVPNDGLGYYAYHVLLAGGARGYKDLHDIAIEQNPKGRGLPTDRAGATTAALKGDHHVSWVSLRELVEYDWGRTAELDVALHLRDADALASPSPWKSYRDDAYESWRHVHPRSAPDGGVGVMGNVLTMAQADDVLDRGIPLPWYMRDSAIARVHVEWTETLAVVCRPLRDLYDSLIDDETRELLPVARDARLEGDEPRYLEMTSALDRTRLVFGFC